MSKILLPPDAQLVSNVKMRHQVQDGVVLPVIDVCYPSFCLSMEDAAPMQAWKEWKSDNPQEHARLFDRPRGIQKKDDAPFEISRDGIAFDPAWMVFANLGGALGNKQVRQQEEQSQRVLDMFADADLRWDLSCDSIRPHTTLVAMCMREVGMSNGVLPGSQLYFDPIAPGKVLSGLKKASISPQQLRDFTDGGLTLLDVATRYQCWDVAQWLWNKGVRFSPGVIDSGQALLDIAVAYESCAKSLKGFESPDYILRTRLPASQWFSRWIDRWEKSGGTLPQEAKLDWAAITLKERGFTPPFGESHPLITPQQMFASRAIPTVSGNNILPLERAPKEHIASLQVWVGMFARHGLDILELDYKEVVGRDNRLVMSDRLGDLRGGEEWKGMIRAQVSGILLATSTPSAPSSKSSAPRL